MAKGVPIMHPLFFAADVDVAFFGPDIYDGRSQSALLVLVDWYGIEPFIPKAELLQSSVLPTATSQSSYSILAGSYGVDP